LGALLDIACMRMQFANAAPVPKCPDSSDANALLPRAGQPPNRADGNHENSVDSWRDATCRYQIVQTLERSVLDRMRGNPA
jgi:hypothetical protein